MPAVRDLPLVLLRRYGLPVLSAVALNLTFFPWRQEWLIWVAFVPLLVWLADPAVTGQQAFSGLLLAGFVYHFTLLVPFLSIGWGGWGTTTLPDVRHYFAYQRVFIAVLIGAIAVWGGVVFAWLGQFFRPYISRPLAGLWVIPSVWVFCLEYLGHRTVFGFGWGLIGNRLHGHEALRQVASITGVYGLSFLVLMGNVVAASWVLYLLWRMGSSSSGRSQARSGHVPGALIVSKAAGRLLIGSGMRYGRSRIGLSEAPPPVRVALLQGARAEYTVDDFTVEGFDRLYGALLDQAIIHGSDLILLPETVWLKTLQLDGTVSPWTKDVISAAEVQRTMAQKLKGSQTVVAFGIDAVSGGRTYNTTTYWNAEGLLGVYRKRRLVPFSEYRPAVLGRFAPQNVIHGLQFAYTPGEGPQLLRMGPLTVGSFICQEVMFPGLVRQTVRDGAQLLVTTGNDGVFGSPIVAWEQSNLATLRAVENGRYLLRCMKTGVSAVIDPRGHILASAPVNAQTIVYGAVRPRTGATFYTRFGDWIAWLAGVVVALAVLARLKYPEIPMAVASVSRRK